MKKTIFMIIIFITLINEAKAYIDPGTGSIVVQVIVSIILGGIFFIKKFFNKIKMFFHKLFRRK